MGGRRREEEGGGEERRRRERGLALQQPDKLVGIGGGEEGGRRQGDFLHYTVLSRFPPLIPLHFYLPSCLQLLC